MAQRFLGYGRQTISDSDIEAVTAVLKGDMLTQGPAVPAFEKAVADYVGARYAVAVANGTAALHIACLAAGVGPGDVGVTQGITFVASANCIAYCGGRPDFVDIDSSTVNMSAASLEVYLAETPECKVIIPVSMGGLSVGGEGLRALAGDRIIIEDASHSCGADFLSGKKVGVSEYADMTTFSFHPVKPFTTGEGGLVVTDREDLYEKLIAFRSHGIVRGPERVAHKDEGGKPWYYEQQVLGYNYRLTDIQCALGMSQLTRIDEFISRRREIALAYDDLFRGMDARLSPIQSNPEHRAICGHHLYLLSIDYDAIGKPREEVMAALRDKRVGSQVHYIPVYRQPYYEGRYSSPEEMFPASEAYYAGALSIPIFPTMTDDEVGYVADAIRAVVTE